MQRVCLIHWNAAEAEKRIALLRIAGCEVEYNAKISPAIFRAWRTNPPVAFVIDLTRLPSQGCDVGITLRTVKSTRRIALVLVEGAPDKVERCRKHLPDAVYTSWGKIRSSLRSAIAKPPSNPVVPESNLAGYSGTSLPKKLGIKANSTVALVGSPTGFERTLGKLPDGVKFHRRSHAGCGLTIWFVRSQAELNTGIEKMGDLAGARGLWIVWPKQSSGVASNLTQNVVRQTGLASGLVDYKICALDATWSGLKFTRRKSK